MKKRPGKIERHLCWDRYNPQFFDHLSGQQIRETIKKRILEYIENEGYSKIMEIGFGSGYEYERLREDLERYNVKYIGVDYTQKFIEAARKKYPEADLFQGDIRKLDFEDNTVDLIFAYHVLEHQKGISDVKKAIKEMCRVAKEKVVIIWFKAPSIVDKTRKWKDGAFFVYKYSAAEIWKVVLETNFVVKEIIWENPWHNTVWILEKKKNDESKPTKQFKTNVLQMITSIFWLKKIKGKKIMLENFKNTIMRINKDLKVKRNIEKIKINVSNLPYNKSAVFNFNSLEKTSGVHKLCSEKGEVGLVSVIHTPSFKALKRMTDFTKKGGKFIYLPMFAGIPLPDEAPMYSIISHATPKPAEYLKKSNTINVSTTDFLPIGRFYPMPDVEKKYDFFIVTWAGDIKHKRWDLVVQLIEELCPQYKLCVLAYKGTPSRDEQNIINEFVDKGNLTFITKWISKENFPIIMNSAKVLIVPSEWDNHPRIMDQALLCNIPIVVNKNIYGGQKLINKSTGILSSPEDLSKNAEIVLKELTGKAKTREWYLDNYGPYNATIKLTACINEVFGTKFKIVYEEGREFMFEEDYIIKCGLPESIQNYFVIKKVTRRMSV